MAAFNPPQPFNPDQVGSGTAALNSDLLSAALDKAGVETTPGRTKNANIMKRAIGEENRMIGGWNLSPLMIIGERIDPWPTVNQQQSYTIGKDPTGKLTADWDGERPLKNGFVRANLLLPTDIDPTARVRRPLAIWDANDWGGIHFQAVYAYPQGLYPLFNDPQKTPFTRIYFHPIPDGIYQVELITRQRIPRFETVGDIVLLPDGYEDAIVNNLAVRLASFPWTFQRPMDPQVRVDAQISLDLIRQSNAFSPAIRTEGELQSSHGYYNYRSGLVE